MSSSDHDRAGTGPTGSTEHVARSPAVSPADQPDDPSAKPSASVGHGNRGQPAVLGYMPQLDSLRALAVLAVFIEHFVQPTDPVRAALPWGSLGVRLFFVLSGFLITRILLSARGDVGDARRPLGTVLRHFYARRFLRLFPAYYAYLALISVMFPAMREHLVVFLAYLQNFLFACDRATYGTLIAHFWTLAVEEQFYLTWPWLVLLLPHRFLLRGILGVVILGPVLRSVALAYGLTAFQVEMMMPAHFDTLGMGSLLAILVASDRHGTQYAERLLRIGIRVGTPLLLLYLIGRKVLPSPIDTIIGESAAGLVFVWLVGRASVGFRGIAGKLLSQPVLIYLGRISYGLYVFHFCVPRLLRYHVAPFFGMSKPACDWLHFPIYAAVSIAIAAASWHFYEKSVNGLKRYFPYSTSLRAVGSTNPNEPSSFMYRAARRRRVSFHRSR